MANRHPFVLAVVAALALFVQGANIGFSQTRDFDFGPDGKPTQVGGPGFGQTATAPAAQPPVPGQPGQPGAQPSAPVQPLVPPVKPASTAQSKVPDQIPLVGGMSQRTLIFVILGLIAIGVVVFIIFNRKKATPDEEPMSDRPPTSDKPDQPPAPPQSPASEVKRPGPPAHLKPKTPAPETKPGEPSKPEGPPPAEGGGKGGTSAVIALLAVLFTAQAVKAENKTANINSMYPSAVATGNSVLSTLKGAGFDGLAGCSVAIPDVGCSLDYVSSPSEAVVRLTAGGGAMGTGREPLRGTLRLRFSDGSFRDFSNRIAVGTTEQLGTAMLAPHVIPPQAPMPAAPKYLPGRDKTARDAAMEAARAAQTAQQTAQGVSARVDGHDSKLAELEARIVALESRPQAATPSQIEVEARVAESKVREWAKEEIEKVVAPVRRTAQAAADGLTSLTRRVESAEEKAASAVEKAAGASRDALTAWRAAEAAGEAILADTGGLLGGGPPKSRKCAVAAALGRQLRGCKQ